MSLQGSLETFALPDVLVLLSSTKKDGELRVAGGRVDGRIWLEKGQMVHASMGGRETPFVDAVFELLRLDAGTFVFEAESAPPRRGEPHMIDLVLADAQVRLGEWNDIARVVPHLDAVVDMAAEAPGDIVTVTRDHWSLLRSVAGGRSVHDLMEQLGRSEFETCRTVKELVDARLASIDVDAAARPAKEAPVAKAVEEPAPKPAAKDETKAAAAKLDPGERPVAKEEPKRTAKPAAEEEPKDPAAHADELEALAELASRPRRARAAASGGEETAATNGNRTEGAKAPQPVEEAKALVAQLAALSGDDEEEVAAKVTEHLASGGELPEVPEGDEPINRGLLLKFLSSVRS